MRVLEEHVPSDDLQVFQRDRLRHVEGDEDVAGHLLDGLRG